MPLALFEIDDAERFVAAIVSRSGLDLSYHDRADLEQFLLVQCWELSRDFSSGAISFSTFAGTILRKRVIDWQRRDGRRTRWVFRDRVYERPRVELVSLDGPDGDSLGPSLTTDGGDDPTDRLSDGRWLEAERDRHLARDLTELSAGSPQVRAG